MKSTLQVIFDRLPPVEQRAVRMAYRLVRRDIAHTVTRQEARRLLTETAYRAMRSAQGEAYPS